MPSDAVMLQWLQMFPGTWPQIPGVLTSVTFVTSLNQEPHAARVSMLADIADWPRQTWTQILYITFTSPNVSQWLIYWWPQQLTAGLLLYLPQMDTCGHQGRRAVVCLLLSWAGLWDTLQLMYCTWHKKWLFLNKGLKHFIDTLHSRADFIQAVCFWLWIEARVSLHVFMAEHMGVMDKCLEHILMVLWNHMLWKLFWK